MAQRKNAQNGKLKSQINYSASDPLSSYRHRWQFLFLHFQLRSTSKERGSNGSTHDILRLHVASHGLHHFGPRGFTVLLHRYRVAAIFRLHVWNCVLRCSNHRHSQEQPQIFLAMDGMAIHSNVCAGNGAVFGRTPQHLIRAMGVDVWSLCPTHDRREYCCVFWFSRAHRGYNFEFLLFLGRVQPFHRNAWSTDADSGSISTIGVSWELSSNIRIGIICFYNIIFHLLLLFIKLSNHIQVDLTFCASDELHFIIALA